MDIASFRNRIGLTQAELADRLGLATGSVGNLCSGSKRPSYEVIEKLLLLGARLDEVFSTEVQEAVLKDLRPVPKDAYSTQEFKDGVKLAVEEMIAAGVLPEKIRTP